MPLKRSVELDNFSLEHANAMAHVDCLTHSYETEDELKERLHAEWAAESVHVGSSMREVHGAALEESSPHFVSLSEPRATEFGMAAARRGGGKIYVCMLFR